MAESNKYTKKELKDFKVKIEKKKRRSIKGYNGFTGYC